QIMMQTETFFFFQQKTAYEKAIAFEALAAHTVGIRQAVETLIKKAKDLEELNAIEFDFRDEA
ncbi:hypothetical protein QG066_10365, partial [Kingella kingae]|nr:hypothetical protein [Kingella kingae]